MTPFEAYQKYLALKLHFSTPNYDYFKFKTCNGNHTHESFERRNDKTYFIKLARNYSKTQLEEFLLSNFIKDDSWVGDILTDKANDNYLEWQKRIGALTYQFTDHIDKLMSTEISFNKLFKSVDGDHPIILKMVLQEEISIESFIILNKILNFFPELDKDIKETLVWPEFKRKCVKYDPFLKIDSLEKYKKIIKEKL